MKRCRMHLGALGQMLCAARAGAARAGGAPAVVTVTVTVVAVVVVGREQTEFLV